jgi:VWFA-related protein
MRPLLITLLLAATASAQQVGQNATPSAGAATYTLSVKSQLVIETVTAKDKQGHSIDGLTAKDFIVTEDGAPQTVRILEHQHLPTAAAAPVAAATPEDIYIYNKLTRTQITPEDSSKARYNDRRLMAMYFDMTAMRPADQMRALGSAEQFVRTQMTDADLVSILRYSGGAVDVLQDFTADRNRLLSILQTLVVGEGQGDSQATDDASSADTGAAFGQDDSEFNVFNTDRQLSALQTTAVMLGQLTEKKVLLYFASGLTLNGVNNQAQLHATIDAAIRAGVAFWPIDARGLVAGAPLGDATQGSPGNAGIYNGGAALAVSNNFQQSQDTIVQAQQSIADYYIVGYYTTNSSPDGRFRKVNIKLNGNADAKLEYREGYYANKEFAKFTTVDKERQLEDALMLKDPITELTIAMEIDYFQLNRAEYFVPIVVKIPGHELALAKRGGADHTLIDFVGEIKDAAGGTTVTNLRDNVNIKLTDATAAELARRPIEYDAGFTLLPGKYILKFLARDDETGRIGTYETPFTVPNLNKELTHVPISSVVLSSQRVDLKDAIYDSMKKKDAAKEAAADPLVQNGSKLIPSVTRVFAKDHPLYVFLQAYKPAATAQATGASATTEPAAAQPVVAFVTLYRAGVKAFETAPQAVNPPSTSRLGATPLNFSIGLTTLPSGEYECQVTVLDPTGGKATFWQTPIMISP